MKNLKLFLFNLLLSLVGACFPAPLFAQYNGIVALQTVQATVANTATCTGTEQDFATSSPTLNALGFKNIGQTSHLATATSTATEFQMEIDGIDNLGNVFRLSDLQLGIPTSAKGGLVVTASGYMTNIQIAVTCTAGATFSISYSGSFSPQPPNVAGALLTAIDKLPFQTAAANANASTTFQSPTANSAGTIIFQFAATGPAGSSINVQCLGNSGAALSLFTFSLATSSSAQLFTVPGSTCPFVTLSYVSGGASATTYNLEYAFATQGSSTPSNSVSISGPLPAGTNTLGGFFLVTPAGNYADPCLSPTVQKKSAALPLTNAATTVQVIALVAGQTIYVCGIDVTATWGGTNFTYQWEYGTGASCGTGTTALSGAKVLSNANIINDAISGATLFGIPSANALCLVMSAATGGSAGIGGFVSYVQQ